VGMSKSSYYYQCNGGKGGAKPSASTQRVVDEGQVTVPNQAVVEYIRELLKGNFVDYGYQKTCAQLQLNGYLVNPKKVYRLMKENKLLNPQRLRKGLPRNFVKHRVVKPRRPLEILEMDIKYVYVPGQGRNAFVLTVIDTFTRMALGWKAGFAMTKAEVKALWESIIEEHLQTADLLARQLSVTVRSDNGAQFLAKTVREFLWENHLLQENTHPYTPQENGHVESFHAILGTALEDGEFENLGQVLLALKSFYDFYNGHRIHSSICSLPPKIFWQAFEQGLVEVTEGKKKMKYRLLEKRQHLLKKLTFRQCEPEGVCA
jgi:transposase InsO family protein